MEKTTVIITGAVYGPGNKLLPKGEPFETDAADAERLVRLGAARRPEAEKETAPDPAQQGAQTPEPGPEPDGGGKSALSRFGDFLKGLKKAPKTDRDKLKNAIRYLLNEDPEKAAKDVWTQDGLPRDAVLEEMLGFKVSADDRLHALEEVGTEPDNG